MMRKYIKVVPIEAEQFDGSTEMAEKYGLKKFGWQGFVKELGRNDFELGGPLLIRDGDWFCKGDNNKYFVLSDSEFQRTFKEVNDNATD